MLSRYGLRPLPLVMGLLATSVARAQTVPPTTEEPTTPDATPPAGEPPPGAPDATAPDEPATPDAEDTPDAPPVPPPPPVDREPDVARPPPPPDGKDDAIEAVTPPQKDVAAAEKNTPSAASSEAASSSAPPSADMASTYATVRGFSFNAEDADIRVKPVAEVGALFVLWHRYQGGSDGTDFNWRRDGGQASAALTWRISAEIEIFDHHELILLYQPVDLRTRATLTEDLRVNGLTFPSGTPMQFRYGFDFYRLSYLYDFLPDPEQELAVGASLQLRVADIEFASLDGSLQRTSQNLGPVPLIKLRGRYTFDNDLFLGTEIDGIGIRFPSDQGSVLGLFFDTSLRVGYSPTQFLETFLNLRYFGGGARGPGSEPLSSEFGDGYNDNFIHTFTTSVGFAVK